MKRRPFLHLAVGAVAATGCLGQSEAPGESPSSTTTSASTTTAGSTDAARTEQAKSDAGPLAVEEIESDDYAVRLNDLGENPSGGITPFADLDDREQRVVETALADDYETDDPPEWLLQFAAGLSVVERSGTYHRLDHDLPTTTITAETVTESDVDGEIAEYDEYRAAVTYEGRIMSGLLRIARREGMEFTYVWPSLREFLDAYSAARYHGDVVSFSAEVEDSGSPYRITATEISLSEAVRADVWTVSDADEETRELVRKAGAESGAYGFDSVPEGFFDALENHQYVYLDGTFYTTYIEKRGPAPVSFSAEVVDGKLELSLRNDADSDLEITTGAPRPFGVLYANPIDDADDSHLLWTDAYEESDHVQTEGREVNLVESIGLTSTVAPGERLSETYEVDVENLPTGEYAIEGSVGVAGDSDVEGTAPYRVVFSVS